MKINYTKLGSISAVLFAKAMVIALLYLALSLVELNAHFYKWHILTRILFAYGTFNILWTNLTNTLITGLTTKH